MLERTLVFSLSVAFASMLSGCYTKSQEQQLSYETDIKPLMDSYCADCHSRNGDGTKASGFSIETYETVMKGTRFGPVIVAGDPLSSTLYRLVAGKTDPSIHMPHRKKSMTAQEVSKIEQWIEQGAKDI